MLPWYFSDTAIAAALAIVAAAVAVVLAFRDRYERQLVDFDPTRTKVELQEHTGVPHRATLSLLNRGNRATVVRDVKLVSSDGSVILSYRLAGRGCSPPLPLRLDAPDEAVVVLELTNEQEEHLNRFEVEYLGGKGVGRVEWPYLRLPPATLSGTASVIGVLSTEKKVAPESKAPSRSEKMDFTENRSDALTPAGRDPPADAAASTPQPGETALGGNSSVSATLTTSPSSTPRPAETAPPPNETDPQAGR